MINGVHAMFYTPQPDELRAFLRDKLGLPFVDTGGGWLIFSLGATEVGAHPASESRQQLSFTCDDLPRTVAELTARGVEFAGGISEQEWGWLTRFSLPGIGEVELFQPKYSLQGARPA